MPEMAQQPGEFWHSFISSPEPGHFPPKTERGGGGKSSSLTSLMAEKMQTLSFIHSELSPMTPPGSPRSQAKAAWTVIPPESWLGRVAGQHL